MTNKFDQLTPPDIAKRLLTDVDFKQYDVLFEPCRGDGAFYDNFPSDLPKHFCEIKEGKDLFKHTPESQFYTKCITNPPYKMSTEWGDLNICIKFIEKCMDITRDECWFLLNGTMFSSLTPMRLHRYEEKGWKLCFIRIVNITKWYGRYYWICFSKQKDAIIKHSI